MQLTSHSLLIAIEFMKNLRFSYRTGNYCGRCLIFISGSVEFKSQDLISDSYPHSHKALSIRLGRRPQNIYIFFFNLMLNLKNKENDAVFMELKKKKISED